MVDTRAHPVGGSDSADRLARIAAMVTNAVDLLNKVMDEVKGEKGDGDDDGDASSASDGEREQPGGRRGRADRGDPQRP